MKDLTRKDTDRQKIPIGARIILSFNVVQTALSKALKYLIFSIFSNRYQIRLIAVKVYRQTPTGAAVGFQCLLESGKNHKRGRGVSE